MSGEVFVHLGVAGHWLTLASDRIPIDVVPAAGPKQAATVLFQFPQQLAPLHTASCFTE
jgi:hypothetical protein